MAAESSSHDSARLLMASRVCSVCKMSNEQQRGRSLCNSAEDILRWREAPTVAYRTSFVSLLRRNTKGGAEGRGERGVGRREWGVGRGEKGVASGGEGRGKGLGIVYMYTIPLKKRTS